MTATEKREHAALIVVNVLVIIAAETLGGGQYFYRARLIEGVALLFMLLPLMRVFTNFRVYDPTILRVIQASLAALLIFTESHATAYAGHYFFGLDGDTVQALIANFYIAGLLSLIIGAELVLRKISKRPKYLIWIPVVAFLCLSALNMSFAFGVNRPSLGPTSQLPMLYTLVIACVAAFGFVSFNRLRGHLPLLKGFIAYFMAGAGFIAISAFISFFAFVLATAFGLEDSQIAYVGAFSFFAAVSLMFLAFGKLKGFGGIYKDLQEEAAQA